MNKTVNGIFSNPDQATNTWDDLIGLGIPQDNVFVDRDSQVIRVSVPAETEREILEVFRRHGVLAES